MAARMGMAIGGVALLGVAAVIGFGGVGDLGGVFGTTQDTTDTVAERIGTVDLDTGSGTVTVRSGQVAKTTVARHIEYSGLRSAPDRTFQVNGATLHLDQCGSMCSIDYTVTVPASDTFTVTGEVGSGDVNVDRAGSVRVTNGSGRTDVRHVHDADLHSGSGDISVADSGPVAAETGSGQVNLMGVNGRAQAKSSSGDIVATRIAGPVEADASSGDVQVGTTVGADVHAVSSSGDVRVQVPRDARYRVDGQNASGAVGGALASDPNAPFALTARSSSGGVVLTTT